MAKGLEMLIVFLVYSVAVAVFGVVMAGKQKSGEQFLLASRSLGSGLVFATTLATLIGTGSSMGACGLGYKMGFSGLVYGIGSVTGMLLVTLLFTDTRKYGFATMSEEVSMYYGANKPIQIIVAALLFLAEVGWLGVHMMGGGTYLSWVTGLDIKLAILITALAFAVYSLFGGYLAVVWTDLVQLIVLSAGLLLLGIMSVPAAGGWERIRQAVPQDYFKLLGPSSGGIWPLIALWLSLIIQAPCMPAYRQRIYSSRSVEDARKSFLLTAVCYAAFMFIPIVIGISAYAINPKLPRQDLAFPFMLTNVFPPLLGALFLSAGLSATASSADSDLIAAVSLLISDLWYLVTGKLPAKEKMVAYSRVGTGVVAAIAFCFTLFAKSIIDLITKLAGTVFSGLVVTILLGRYWKRATWQGGVASIVCGSTTAFLVMGNPAWKAAWSQPAVPALIAAFIAHVAVSLLTPATSVPESQALEILKARRQQMGL
ncbi:MAG: sodium:solute symporter family protein [Bacillota bacterium]